MTVDPKKFSNQMVREKLKELIRQHPTHDYTSVSQAIGRNHAYIQQFINRGVPSRLRENDRKQLAQMFDVAEWELGGNMPDYKKRPNRGFAEAYDEGVVFVASYDVKASAGSGSFVEDDWPQKFVPFRASTVRQFHSPKGDSLTVITVSGDSMEPTLFAGDDILVDTNNTDATKEGIFVLRIDETLHVKRLSLNPATGKLTIKSDNPLYETWVDCAIDTINILGRVVWFSRTL
ncbi:MAG: helix-turn-helix transcriptional regulator [Sphingomonadales bacterium]|nr:helix-turn-helix transcriptional regulator [Sphingomonadales bacterium]